MPEQNPAQSDCAWRVDDAASRMVNRKQWVCDACKATSNQQPAACRQVPDLEEELRNRAAWSEQYMRERDEARSALREIDALLDEARQVGTDTLAADVQRIVHRVLA